ncbi:50S ribosomal protein L35 [bacterium]|nr:50S ribosomal protein L35 [bacterium]
MPKMKTHRGAAKRFKKTASGKFKRSKAYASHCLNHKTAKQKNQLNQATTVNPVNQKNLSVLLPYA